MQAEDGPSAGPSSLVLPTADNGAEQPSSAPEANPSQQSTSNTSTPDGNTPSSSPPDALPRSDEPSSSDSGGDGSANGHQPLSDGELREEGSSMQIEVVKPEDALPDLELHSDLLDSSSDDLMVTSDGLNGQGDGEQAWVDLDCDMKRIKVYELVGSRWVDQGTALCFGHIGAGNIAYLTARSEKAFDQIILSTAIRASDVYQRQQETLIVWTEPDGVDYALSFQDPDGCAEVWGFIQEVQRLMKADNESSPSLGGSEPSRPNQLPPPQLGMISDIERSIKQLSRTQAVKERICEYIQQEEYIKQMIEVMTIAEDLEALDNLHALCSLMQTILMLNDHSLYEHILDDDIFFGVVGMLEYDPEFPLHKANYREFLSNNSHFHQPIPIHDQAIQRKIHHTYRLQFLKDVVLARALDDSTFNVLNSCIIFNQIDIITHVQQDIPFLREIVKLYVDEDMLSGGGIRKQAGESEGQNGNASSNDATSEGLSRRREVIHLIQQLCAMGKSVQLPARLTLFRSLVDRGILFAVQWALSQPESDEASKPIISAAGEILTALLDHDLNGVRGHVLKHVTALEKEREVGKKGLDKAETLLHLVCKIMAQSKDLAVQSQIGDALRSWLDLPSPSDIPTTGGGEAGALAMSKFAAARKDDPTVERFMDFFYKDCVHVLFKPLHQLPDWKSPDPLKLTREQTNRFVYLCDLLYNFSMQHHFRSHFFIMSSNICSKVATLFRARDKHLRHASFRFFRLLLKQNNPNMHTQVMKHDVLSPILDLTISESRRDNLLSCCCQEYFEHMRRENMKDMIKFCMTRHEDKIRQLAESLLGGERFQLFIRRWEMNNEPPPPESTTKPVETRGWPSQSRVLDTDEENYFNNDDEDDEVIPPISHQPLSRGSNGITPQIPSVNTLKRKRRIALSNAAKGFRPTPRTPTRSPFEQLSDYSEEDDDETVPLESESSSDHTPTSRTASTRKPPPSLKLPRKDEDADEDNLLANIARRSPRPQSPAPGMMASTSSLGPVRLSEKRRRDDDDDDLEGLIKTKKPDLGGSKDPGVVSGRGAKTGDDPPKKLKLKVDSSSVVAASASTSKTPSEDGSKDGDTG